MSVLRSFNFLGQMRVDVPHLRTLESSICADFDLIAGKIIAGSEAYIVKGFGVYDSAHAVSKPANQLAIEVDGGVLMHSTASESGTIYFTPAGRANETLNSVSNTRVAGSFTAGTTNYVGLDLRRTTDDTTADAVKFWDPDSEQEVPKTVALGRTLDYQIIISTTDFTITPWICPIAVVVTDANNTVSSITDARQLIFRLGSGGTIPNRQNIYAWLTRKEETVAGQDVFSGGDKQIDSMKGWMDAVMTRLWELGGGEYWYAPASDRDVKLIRTGAAPYANSDYIDWNTGTKKIQWSGLKVLFGNSVTGAYYCNTITNSAAPVSIADGQCLYVDLNRSSNAPITAQVADLATLGAGTPPGSRWVIAWRKDTTPGVAAADSIYVRDNQFYLGTAYAPASTVANGMVRLNADVSDNGGLDAVPVVSIVDNNGYVVGTGLTRDATGGVAGSLSIGTESALVNRITAGSTDTGYLDLNQDITLRTASNKVFYLVTPGAGIGIGTETGGLASTQVSLGSTADIGSIDIANSVIVRAKDNFDVSVQTDGGVINIGTEVATDEPDAINIGSTVIGSVTVDDAITVRAKNGSNVSIQTKGGSVKIGDDSGVDSPLDISIGNANTGSIYMDGPSGSDCIEIKPRNRTVLFTNTDVVVDNGTTYDFKYGNLAGVTRNLHIPASELKLVDAQAEYTLDATTHRPGDAYIVNKVNNGEMRLFTLLHVPAKSIVTAVEVLTECTGGGSISSMFCYIGNYTPASGGYSSPAPVSKEIVSVPTAKDWRAFTGFSGTAADRTAPETGLLWLEVFVTGASHLTGAKVYAVNVTYTQTEVRPAI